MVEKRNIKGLTIFYRSKTIDEVVLKEQFNYNIFLSQLPEYRIHQDDVIIDIGAHIGAFSILAAIKAKKVYAIEAAQESYEYLQKNVQMNHLSNVEIYHLALAGQKGETLLFHDPKGNWGHTIKKDKLGGYEVVSTDSLTNFMIDNHIMRCDLLKMNCEGAEFDIIFNTSQEVLRHIRILLILYHLDLVPDQDESNLIHYLNEHGFIVETRNKTEKRGWIVARNKAFMMRTDEVIQYSIWQVFMKTKTKRLFRYFLIFFSRFI